MTLEVKVSELESNNIKLKSQLDSREQTINETNELGSPVKSNDKLLGFMCLALVDQKKESLQREKELSDKIKDQQVTIDELKRLVKKRNDELCQFRTKQEEGLDIADYFF